MVTLSLECFDILYNLHGMVLMDNYPREL